MRIIDDVKLDFKDVLFTPKRSTLSTRKEVSLLRKFTFRNSGLTWEGVPIIASNMDGVGTFAMHEALSKEKLLTCLVKHYDIQNWKHQFNNQADYIIPSTGISEDDLVKTMEILKHYADLNFLCVDVANGYTTKFLRFIEQLRKKLDNELGRPITIIAGNVVTPEITEELILNGVDIVKVGIGPGSVCTTRKQTGVGYPQLSAIIECADAAHGLGGHIIGDGGCVNPGDVAKAFGAGADFVMLGGMLSGHKEGGNEADKDGNVVFYGMSSASAMNKHNGGVAEYRSSEGKAVKVPYKGEVKNTISDILGGIRSTCTYVGAKHLKELSKRTTFVRVTQQINNIFTQEVK